MRSVDILIIGAGIHGAGTAQAAAAAGFSTLVLEQYPRPACGTSSRSSKLIHGGLRYLEGGHFRLVRESLKEQALLLKNAPELVRRLPFYFPVYDSGQRPAWMVGAGLTLYSLLGGSDFSSLPSTRWQELDGLNTKGLRHVFRYWDAQTDDALLTRAVLASAEKLGAELLLGAALQSAERGSDGYVVHFVMDGTDHEVRAGMVINAAGPWVNRVLAKFQPQPAAFDIELVAGTHIVLPGEVNAGIYYLESPADGRAVFVMPWKGHTLMGTTETPYAGDPAMVAPLESEVDYLLDIHNHYFGRNLGKQDVIESFAGLRVLPAAGSSPFRRSRETILHPDDASNPRLFTIYGGKLTAYRATAERLLERIKPLLPKRQPLADTRHIQLIRPAA